MRRAGLLAVGLVVVVVGGLGAALVLGGSGLRIQAADLFVITRTGPGPRLTLEVNSAGSIRCDGGRPKRISSALLIQARDLSDDLGTDASKHLTLPVVPGTVFSYRIRMPQGTVSFADRDARTHPELVQAEVFTLAAAQGPCGRVG